MNTEEKVSFASAVAVAALFVTGHRRLAGAVTVGDGLYALSRGKTLHAAASIGLGSLVALWPDEWLPGGAREVASAPEQLQLPPIRRVSIPQDDLIDGNWTILDVSELRDSKTAAAAKKLVPGDSVTLALSHAGGEPLGFKVKVIAGGKPPYYEGQWISKPPVGGPQLVSFREQHVLKVWIA